MDDLVFSHAIVTLAVILILLPIALLPTIIALKRNHPYKLPIILINILGGLIGGIGWLVALVWSLILPNKTSNASANIAGEIEKLHELLEKGILTQAEFDSKKSALLKA